MAARLRKGDQVVVISGRNKGEKGEISRVLPEEGKVVIKGINFVKRHTRPNARNQKGSIVTREAAIHLCKVMPVDPKTGVGTRIRFQTDEKGEKYRIAVKSNEKIDRPISSE